ncbi:MAG: ABC transporter permease [Candidatus Zixiibacteriota bacterium]|nr:MAG: ABC transporter permease [candidate division Zixibacteria bacterium]
MFRNYLKVALRNMVRHKGYSFINVAGLAIGMTCCILILLWVQDELSYDRFHDNAGQLHRVAFSADAERFRGEYVPGPLAAYLKDEYPEIVNSTVFCKHSRMKLSVEGNGFFCAGSFVDPSFFEMFTFPFAQGDPKRALSEPLSVVMTRDLAERMFGRADVVGKAVTIEGAADLNVTGVLESLPHNSHIQFDFLIPYSIAPPGMKRWDIKSLTAYVLLDKNSSHEQVSEKISGVLNEHNPTWENYLFLQPLKQIHLYALGGGGRITYVVIFSILAFIILLVACINFMNLSTVRSEKRLKEIGIRMAVGSSRIQLIKQFLSESIFISSVALVVAIVLVELLISPVNVLLAKQLHLDYSGGIILGLIGIAMLTGIIAGSYPAFLLSSFRPVALLGRRFLAIPLPGYRQRKASAGMSRFSMRRVLVVAQFAISIFFIVCVIVIFNQLDYIGSKDMGLDPEFVVVLRTQGELARRSAALKNELLQNPNILSAAAVANGLESWNSSAGVEWSGMQPDQIFDMGLNWVDYDFLKTFGIEMAEGRFFSEDIPTDKSDAFVVNQAAVKAMGMNDPVGQRITVPLGDRIEGRIIGVVQDFHTESFHTQIRPYGLRVTEGGGLLYIKAKSDDLPGALRHIEATVKKFVPDDPCEYSFLEDRLGALYSSEQRMGTLLQYSSLLAIIISCLGLFGLAAYSAERRTKEIGIRKVLGASVSGLFRLLTKEFILLVVLANLLAWPIAYWAMNQWLQNFAYRVGIGWETFIIAGASALLIALFTVSFQAVKAALTNPVETLRYE